MGNFGAAQIGATSRRTGALCGERLWPVAAVPMATRDSFTNRVILCALSGIPDNAHHPGRGVIRGGAAAVLLGAWIDAAGSRIIGVLSA